MKKLLGSTAYLTSLKTIVWWVINQSDKSRITIEIKFVKRRKKWIQVQALQLFLFLQLL
jgi:hypothetical protein